MAKSIGVVSQVIGEVFAVGADGARRLLIEGGRLYVGDQLETGVEGAVAVRLDNGAQLTLGRDSSLLLTARLLDDAVPDIVSPDALPSEAALADVVRIQRAIAAGADPSQEAEATAAGAPQPLGGGHSFVLLTEVGDRVDPEIGFPTAGFVYPPEPGGREIGGRDNGGRYRDGPPLSPPDSPGTETPPDSGTPPGPGPETPPDPGTTPGPGPETPPDPGTPPGPGPETPPDPETPPGPDPQPPQPPTDHPVSLRGLDIEPAELLLDEANLPQGSASDGAALTQRGSFTVVAPDGVYDLSVGGLVVIAAGVVTGVGQSLVTALGNTLTVTGYDAQTGQVSYSYTLNGADRHPDGGGRNTLSEQFLVRVSDVDGDTASGSLDVIVRDDVPTAVDDLDPGLATPTVTQLTGNVLDNDVQGADRVSDGQPIVGGTFQGTYGTLVLAGDGSYTYTLDSNASAFKQLPGAGRGVEVFTYTLRDADGDTSNATLTLNVLRPDNPVQLQGLDVQGGELTLFERYLADGSSPDPAALTQTGTFRVDAPDGLYRLKVGSIDVVSDGVAAGFPQTMLTGLGNRLTITGYDADTGVVSYRYTLQDNATHPTGNGANDLQEQFSVIAQDTDGSTATGSLDVNIVDDVPQATSDSAQVREGGTVSGNVLLNDIVGADVRTDGQYVVGVRAGNDTSTSASGQVGVQVQGQYGFLIIAADGNATYHANPNSVGSTGGRDVFVYTIRDADGDESTATVTLDVRDSGLVACPDWDIKVYEKALDLNKDGNDLAPGTVTGSNPGSRGETDTGSLVGAVSGGVGALTYSLVGSAIGQYGQIQIQPDGTYTYTLTSTPKTPGSPNNGPDIQTETFTYQATDGNGNNVTGNIVVRIVDDVPTAHCDSAQVREGGTVSGNVLLNDIIGADVRTDGQYVVGVRAGNDTSTSASGQVGVQVQGQYGYLTIAADGNATYHANPNSVGSAGGRDVFVYTIRDADGDESTTTVTLDIRDSGLIACADWDIKVYEKALDLNKDGNDLAPGTVIGSNPGSRGETDTGSLVGAVSGGVGALTYSLVGSAVGQYGQIQIQSDGTYTYTLTSAPKTPGSPNNGPDIQTETFTYQATDANGNTVTGSIMVRIVDDVPTAHCDSAQVREGSTVSGNVLLNDIIGADVRTDGQYVVGVRAGNDTGTSVLGQVGTQVQGQYGFLIIAADGNATYHANPNSVGSAGGRDVFVYTIRDADGDESTATVTLDVRDNAPPLCGIAYAQAAPLLLDRAELARPIARGDFVSTPGNLSAVLVVAGLLGAAQAHEQADPQRFTVDLHQGERLSLKQETTSGEVSLAWQDPTGQTHTLDEHGQFVAAHDGIYSLLVSNTVDSGAGHVPQDYRLSLVLDPPTLAEQATQPLASPADAHSAAAFVAVAAAAHPQSAEANGAAQGTEIAAAAVYPATGEPLASTLGASELPEGSEVYATNAQPAGTGATADSSGAQANPNAARHAVALIDFDDDNGLFGSSDGTPGSQGHANGIASVDTSVWHPVDVEGALSDDALASTHPLDLSQLLQGEDEGADWLEVYLHSSASDAPPHTRDPLQASTEQTSQPDHHLAPPSTVEATHLITSDNAALLNTLFGTSPPPVDNV
ncbi:retention module-containing protein [Pseudomonas sp. MLB6B]